VNVRLGKFGAYFLDEFSSLLDEFYRNVRLDWIAGIIRQKPYFMRTAERTSEIGRKLSRLDHMQTEGCP
jgi:hypothetical protein